MRHSAKTFGLALLQAALCYAPAIALLFTALQTDGRGVPETRLSLSATSSGPYAAQMRFYTSHYGVLSVRVAHVGPFNAQERRIKPSDFRVVVESSNPESYRPEEYWYPGYALVWRGEGDTWDSNGVAALAKSPAYERRCYLVTIRPAEGVTIPHIEKFEMIAQVDEIDQPKRLSSSGAFLLFCSFLTAGIGAALFRRNLRQGRILA